MSMLGRIIALFRVKIRKLLNAAEDPVDQLDLSYEKLLTGLQETRRHLADAMAQQTVLERQIASSEAEIAGTEQEAALAVKSDRDDLARAALLRRRRATDTCATQQAALDALLPQVQRLKDYQQELGDRIDLFRTRTETMRVSTAAAEAQLKATHSLTGLDNELGGVGEVYRRAEDKMLDMRSKADAMERLRRDGVLADPFGERSSAGRPGPASSDAAQGIAHQIDNDLALLKAELTPKGLATPKRREDKETS
jgi:phage shock protein A